VTRAANAFPRLHKNPRSIVSRVVPRVDKQNVGRATYHSPVPMMSWLQKELVRVGVDEELEPVSVSVVEWIPKEVVRPPSFLPLFWSLWQHPLLLRAGYISQFLLLASSKFSRW
jgi:hypothetical protein